MKIILKKILTVIGIVCVILLIVGLIVNKIIVNSIDDLNKKSMESYVNAIKSAYTTYMYKNLVPAYDVNELDIKSSVNVECKEITIDFAGNIELYGCSVEGSKRLYKYTNGRVNYEGNKK